MATLFAIGDDLQALADLLTEGGPELAADTTAAVEAWFAELAGREAEKLDAYVSLVRKFEMEAAAAKEECERYALIANARENAARRLKTRLHDYLVLHGRDKVQTPTGRTIAVQVNGGKEPVEVYSPLDLNCVPDQFVTVIPEQRKINTDAVREALKAGQKLGWAELAERGSHLRIR